MTAKEHYDSHLGNFYSWMAGDFTTNCLEQQRFFSEHGIVPMSNGVAIDLGAGHGIQSVALGNLGFNVTAVDFNGQLLAELRINTRGLPVTVIDDDLLHHLMNTNETAELIVCMGDTLTHLEPPGRVAELIGLCSARLARGGRLVLSFRDYSRELTGSDRFIAVRHDDTRILTCFLEYFADHILVHDILQERSREGWKLRVSAYPKLRLSPAHVVGLMAENALQPVFSETFNRMLHIIAVRK